MSPGMQFFAHTALLVGGLLGLAGVLLLVPLLEAIGWREFHNIPEHAKRGNRLAKAYFRLVVSAWCALAGALLVLMVAGREQRTLNPALTEAIEKLARTPQAGASLATLPGVDPVRPVCILDPYSDRTHGQGSAGEAVNRVLDEIRYEPDEAHWAIVQAGADGRGRFALMMQERARLTTVVTQVIAQRCFDPGTVYLSNAGDRRLTISAGK